VHPFQATKSSDKDVFVAQLDPAQSGTASLWYSTLLGGSGAATVVGMTKATDFPVVAALQASKGSEGCSAPPCADVFVSTLSGSGSTLGFSTYLGGSKDDQGYAVARDGTGGVYVAGVSESSNFPVTGGAYDTTANGSRDTFVAKISGISTGGTNGTLATRTITYTYDGLERLTKAVESPGTTYEYAYDLLGNRTEVKTNGTVSESRGYNAADQVVGWTYDAAGNLLSDGTTNSTYDALSRMLTTTKGSEQRSYTYNGDGVLVAQTANGVQTRLTQDLVSPLSQILQATQGTTTKHYVYGHERLYEQAGSVKTWYGSDGLGSVRQTLDTTGTSLSALNYDSWGTPAGGATPPHSGARLLSGNAVNPPKQCDQALAYLRRERWLEDGGDVFFQVPRVAGPAEDDMDARLGPAKAIGGLGQAAGLGLARDESQRILEVDRIPLDQSLFDQLGDRLSQLVWSAQGITHGKHT